MKRFTFFLLFPLCILFPVQAQEKKSSLTLEEAVRHVYASHPSLQAAYASLRAVQERYPQALAGWRPSADAQAGIYTTDIDNSNFSGADGTTTKDFSLNLEQPLWRGGRAAAETDQALSLIMAARSQTNQLEQDLFYEVAVAYIGVARDRTLLDLRYQDEHRLQQELSGAQARFDAGELTLTDVHQAEAELARAQAVSIQAKGRLDTSMATLTELTGHIAPETLYYPALPLSLPGTLDAIIAQMKSNNPRLQAAIHAREAAVYGSDAILRELYPQIFAFASFNQQYDPQPGIIDDSRTSTLGVRATLSLYEGGATRSRVREAKHTAIQRHYEISDIEQSLTARLTVNWQRYQAAKAEIVQRNIEIDAMEQTLTGISEEARMGMRTILDVLDAGQDLIDSRSALAVARYESYIALYSLARDLGMLTPALFSTSEYFDPQEHLEHISHQFFTVEIQAE